MMIAIATQGIHLFQIACFKVARLSIARLRKSPTAFFRMRDIPQYNAGFYKKLSESHEESAFGAGKLTFRQESL
jgi:hypothetical protein